MSRLVAGKPLKRLPLWERSNLTREVLWRPALPACCPRDVGVVPTSGGVTSVLTPAHQNEPSLQHLMRLAKRSACGVGQFGPARGRTSFSHRKLAQLGDAALLTTERRRFKKRQQTPLWCSDTHHLMLLVVGIPTSPVGRVRDPDTDGAAQFNQQPGWSPRAVRSSIHPPCRLARTTLARRWSPSLMVRLDIAGAVAANLGSTFKGQRSLHHKRSRCSTRPLAGMQRAARRFGQYASDFHWKRLVRPRSRV